MRRSLACGPLQSVRPLYSTDETKFFTQIVMNLIFHHGWEIEHGRKIYWQKNYDQKVPRPKTGARESRQSTRMETAISEFEIRVSNVYSCHS